MLENNKGNVNAIFVHDLEKEREDGILVVKMDDCNDKQISMYYNNSILNNNKRER